MGLLILSFLFYSKEFFLFGKYMYQASYSLDYNFLSVQKPRILINIFKTFFHSINVVVNHSAIGK